MRKIIKGKLFKTLLAIFIFTLTFNASAQDIQKYDYAEIVVLQKTAKNKSAFKQIYLNSTTDTNLDDSGIKDIENNARLLKYMNSKNWEYIDRLGSQPSNSGPIWINYSFRKKIK